MKRCISRAWRASALLLALFAAGASGDEAELAKVKEQELEQVRERISELKQSMDRAAADRDRLTGELQAAEIAISEQRLKLEALERERRFVDKRRSDLETTIAEREAELERESAALASQVRAAYMSGGQERMKLLLNQQDPGTLGRVMAWYGYLNEHRGENIELVSLRIRELAALATELAAEEARLEAIATKRLAELAALGRAQEERQSLLAAVKAKIDTESREIDRLAAQEKDLARLIAELATILSDYPITSEEPFAAFRGRLTWPVAGTLTHDFGQPRVGDSLRWNGVVLEAPRGREVRAVYHGRVAFADWLAGLGLLVIVDHGDGYLTLYGYNETVLKNAGDWVAPGDVIATVGSSGGQAESALYFEVRQGTTPVNPREWVTRRPGN